MISSLFRVFAGDGLATDIMPACELIGDAYDIRMFGGGDETMPNADIQNITCAAFAELSEAEQRAFILGVANGRGMTVGLFQAYAGAAQNFASTQAERDAITTSYNKIQAMMSPLLEIDAASLFNGIKAACKRPEFRNEFVINALASLHLDAAKALRKHREESGG